MVDTLAQLGSPRTSRLDRRFPYSELLAKSIAPHLDYVSNNLIAEYIRSELAQKREPQESSDKFLFMINGGLDEEQAFNLAYLPLPESVTIAGLTTSPRDLMTNLIDRRELDLAKLLQSGSEDPSDGWRIFGPERHEGMHLISYAFASSTRRLPYRIDMLVHPEKVENYSRVEMSHLRKLLRVVSTEYVQESDLDPVTLRAPFMPSLLSEARTAAGEFVKSLDSGVWYGGDGYQS